MVARKTVRTIELSAEQEKRAKSNKIIQFPNDYGIYRLQHITNDKYGYELLIFKKVECTIL